MRKGGGERKGGQCSSDASRRSKRVTGWHDGEDVVRLCDKGDVRGKRFNGDFEGTGVRILAGDKDVSLLRKRLLKESEYRTRHLVGYVGRVDTGQPRMESRSSWTGLWMETR